MEEQSLEHTLWNCKYYTVGAPKFRSDIVYRKYRKRLVRFYENCANINGLGY